MEAVIVEFLSDLHGGGGAGRSLIGSEVIRFTDWAIGACTPLLMAPGLVPPNEVLHRLILVFPAADRSQRSLVNILSKTVSRICL